MPIARAESVALIGVDAHVVEVEADVAMGLPHFILTALSDRVLKHVEHRVRSAVVNSGEAWPARKVTVALLPATVPKTGSRYDLPIALSVLAASGALPPQRVAEWVTLGELSLTGAVKPVAGVLPAVIGARRAGRRRLLVPAANYSEARLVPDAEVVAARTLAEVCAWLRGEAPQPSAPDDGTVLTAPPEPDLADVVGQPAARRGVEVAAAGGHHLFLMGSPGVGKTMLAERLAPLLPDLDDDEAMEVTAIHSIAGALPSGRPLIVRPPFCAPHHTATTAALVGGGLGLAKPGAISLAHRGVLFLDEAPEFGARSLDALRQPLESGTVTLARAQGSATYPCRFQLVLAANSCPCSAAGGDESAGSCRCSSPVRERYLARISGPFADRLDVFVKMDRVSPGVLDAGAGGEPTAQVRQRVLAARERARARYRGTAWSTNAEVPGPVLRRHWPVRRDALRPLHVLVDNGRLSTRGLDRCVKVAWTLADLAGADQPAREHVEEAALLRTGYDLTTLRRSA